MSEINKTPLIAAHIKKGDALVLTLNFKDINGQDDDKSTATSDCSYWNTSDMSGAADGSFVIDDTNDATGVYTITMPTGLPVGSKYAKFQLTEATIPHSYFELRVDVDSSHGSNPDMITGDSDITIDYNNNTLIINHTGAIVTGGGGGNVSTSGTPVTGDIARFVNGTNIEGRNITETKNDLAIAAGDLTATGTKDSTTYLRGDNTWTVPPSGAAQSSDLSDYGVTTATNQNIMVADGDSWESTAYRPDIYKGAWSAAGGTFPASALAGYRYRVSVDGTVDSQPFVAGDFLLAIVDSPSTTVYSANWAIESNSGSVVDASTTAKGIIEIATLAEHTSGTSPSLAVTPQGLKQELDAGAQIDDTDYSTGWGSSTAAPQQNKVYDELETRYSVINKSYSYQFDTTDEWIGNVDPQFGFSYQTVNDSGGTGTDPVPASFNMMGMFVRGGTKLRDIIIIGRLFSGSEITDMDISIRTYTPTGANTWLTGIDALAEYTVAEIHRDTYMSPTGGEPAFTGAISDFMIRTCPIDATIADACMLMVWMQPTGTLTGLNKFSADINIELMQGAATVV